ncbi:MAG: transcriptional regulator [Synergistaceae bacterium]|jgi:predicted transcriptional regulator|nr:transcriptional regulator [Synergistaceae bacterium]
MTLAQIAELVGATPLCGEEMLCSLEIDSAFASDLMSDVLAFCAPGAFLITGLTNIQIVRTAQMLDIPAVLFVRGKSPLEETISLARDADIPLILSGRNMFHTCGILYAAGIKPTSSSPEGGWNCAGAHSPGI